MSKINPAEITAILKDQLKSFDSNASLEEVGTVLQVGDGIARVYGLTNVQAGELVEFTKSGMKFYNESILLNAIASASMRANGNMKSQKLVKVHQNILVFKKP